MNSSEILALSQNLKVNFKDNESVLKFANEIIKMRNKEFRLDIKNSEETFKANFGPNIAAAWAYRDMIGLSDSTFFLK